MPVSKKTTKAAAAPAAQDTAALEKKIADLQALVEKLSGDLDALRADSAKQHKDLADRCDAAAAKPSGGVDPILESRVAQMWKLHRRNR